MKLVFIYGPPAAGKLTVANELYRLTGFKIFHNHLTVDLITPIFDFDSEIFNNFNSKFRLELIEAAAKKKVNGLIFTFCYAAKEDDKFVKKLINKIEKHKGKVYFVHLYCNNSELYKRVKNHSRNAYRKIKTPSQLKKTLDKWNLISEINFVENLSIDNTITNPKKVASIIQKHYKL